MKNFVCYLHKPGALAPEIRFISVEDEPELPEAISQTLSLWPSFEVLEVCDDSGEPMFRIGPDERVVTQ